MDFALPATLFSATVQTPWAGIVAQSPLVLVLTGAMWITYAAICFLATSVFKRTPQDAAVLTLTVALPNYAALGLPILGSVLGEGASTSLSVAVSIACGSVLMTPFCLLILEREKPAPRNSGSTLAMLPVLMWRSVKNRSSGARCLGWCFPRSALKCRTCCWRRSNRWAAATAAALFLTGVILSARKLQLNALIATSTIVKLLVQPFIAGVW